MRGARPFSATHAGTARRASRQCEARTLFARGRWTWISCLILSGSIALGEDERLDDYLSKQENIQNVEYRIHTSSDTVGVVKTEGLVRILDRTHFSVRLSTTSGSEGLVGNKVAYIESPKDEVLIVANGVMMYEERSAYDKGATPPVRFSVRTVPITEKTVPRFPGTLERSRVAELRKHLAISYDYSLEIDGREAVVFVGKIRDDVKVPPVARQYLGDLKLYVDKHTGLGLRSEMMGAGSGRQSAGGSVSDVVWNAHFDEKAFLYGDTRETEAALTAKLGKLEAQPRP
jgi:hypothetical protein